MQKPIIDLNDALHDIRTGLDDSTLMKKYQLSAKGLQSMFKKLLALGVITQAELGRGPVPEIKAKDAVRDIRSGMDDFALMDKYSLSAKGLQSLFDQLVAAGLLSRGDLDLRMPFSEGTVDVSALEIDRQVQSPEPRKELETANPAPPPDTQVAQESEPGSAPDITISLKWECPSCGMYHDKEHVVCPVCRAVVGKIPEADRQQAENQPSPERTDATVELRDEEVDIEPGPEPIESPPDTLEGPPPGPVVVEQAFQPVSQKSADATTALVGAETSTDRTPLLEWVCPNCGQYQDKKCAKCPKCGFDEPRETETFESQSVTAGTMETKIKTMEILADIRAGMDKDTVMARHQLSREGAGEFFAKLARIEAHATEGPSGEAAPGEEGPPRYGGRDFAPLDKEQIEVLTAQLIRAADKGTLSEVRRLIRRGADVNGEDDEGQTPLMWAAMWGYVQVMEELIDQGADITRETKDGATALVCATAMCHEEARRLLIERGAKR